jgi:hypothetical protein
MLVGYPPKPFDPFSKAWIAFASFWPMVGSLSIASCTAALLYLTKCHAVTIPWSLYIFALCIFATLYLFPRPMADANRLGTFGLQSPMYPSWLYPWRIDEPLRR